VSAFSATAAGHVGRPLRGEPDNGGSARINQTRPPPVLASWSEPRHGWSQSPRVTIEQAFAAGKDAAVTCLALYHAASDTPLVGIEFDADCKNLRLVAETVVEDGGLTRRQLLSMIDSVVGAAEAWQAAAVRADGRAAA